MPIFDAAALDLDPQGVLLLRSVLKTGRPGRRRKLAHLSGARKPFAPVHRVPGALDREIDVNTPFAATAS